MVIEINKDIDRYQESVAMGLTAKQLVFSIASVIVGGGIVLLLYRYIGLTGSAYVAIPCVAPIALGGFYSFNGMNFYEYMGKKLHFMFGNKALTYVSTEGEPIIKAFEMEQNGQVKKKGKKTQSEITTSESAVKKQEEFEEMKKKTRNMMFGLAAVVVLAVAGVAAYKAMHYKGTCIKTDSLNEGKSLSKNGSPVTFLIEKSDYDYSLLFFINRIKGKVIIDYHKTNAPACQYRIIYQTELLWQVG